MEINLINQIVYIYLKDVYYAKITKYEYEIYLTKTVEYGNECDIFLHECETFFYILQLLLLNFCYHKYGIYSSMKSVGWSLINACH